MNINEYFSNKSTTNYSVCFEGERVKLDVDKIKQDADWNRLRKDYQEFILNNQDTIFTVEYDPIKLATNGEKSARIMVQLKEDTTNPKWLFWAGYLIPHKDDIPKLKEIIIDNLSETERNLQKKLKELQEFVGG